MLGSLLFLLFIILLVFLALAFSFSQPTNNWKPQPNTEERQEQEINQWKKVLTEINDFANTKPRSLAQIEKWVKEKNYSDPLAGVDLAGVDKNTLLSKRIDNGAKQELATAQGDTAQWKKHTPLWTSMDGNCFFHTFSVLLVGDESLADRLRVKLCLELMTGNAFFRIGDQETILAELHQHLPIMSKDGEWQLGDYAIYMAYLLKRPITLVYYWESFTRKLTWLTFNIEDHGETNLYHEPWIIYHTGGIHFVPLVKK